MTYSIFTLIIINLILFIFAFFGNIDGKTGKLFIFFQIFFFSFCFGTRKDIIGTDTLAYISSYNHSGFFKEPIFSAVENIFRALGFSNELYILSISIIMGIIVFIVFNRNLPIKKELLPIVTWIFLSNTMVIFSWVNILRQGLASFIVLLSISFISNGSRKKGFLVICIAVTVHFASIIFIFFYFLYYLSKKVFILKIFNSNKPLYDILILIACFFLSFSISKIPFVANRYPNMGSKILLLKIVIAIIYYFLMKYFFMSNKQQHITVWFDVYFFVICSSIFFYFSTEISNRFLYFSGCFEAILFGIMLSTKKSERKTVFTSALLLNIFYFFYTINTSAFANNFNL